MFTYFRTQTIKEDWFKQASLIMIACLLLITAAGAASSISAASFEHYIQENLLADVPGFTRNTNASLVNPWGMKQSPSGLWWVADNGEGVITAHTGQGTPSPGPGPLRITVPLPPTAAGLPSTPTGIVINSTADFILAAGKPAQVITVTQEGTVSGWNPEADKHNAILVVDNSSFAVYTGAAIGHVAGGSRLYAANFRGGTVDVFDGYFHQIRVSTGAFIDSSLPDGYAPFNVQYIDGKIYVAYARQDTDQYQAVKGAGLGFVSVYDPGGKFLTRLQSGPWMNAPWGIAPAPSGFGKYGKSLLVANSGNGTISAYDPVTGRFKGLLKGEEGNLIMIQGLHEIGFGSNDFADAARLYFCAGIEEGVHGLFGFVGPKF